jgi:competence protein ComEC
MVRSYWKYLFGLLLLMAVVAWVAVFDFSATRFRLIACDVGQGDAILVVYGDFEILTDGGGPNGKVVGCLSRYMPFWDREVEVVVNTHPQLDHYGGLIEVFRKYKVDYFIASALESSSQEYQVLKREVGRGSTKVINPLKGQSIRYGMMHYDIFWPTKEFLMSEGWNGEEGILGKFTSDRDSNDFSVQAVVGFGSFSALLTGDVGQSIDALVLPNFDKKSVNYIKIPHHGSKYGLTTGYLSLFKPDLAVISVGKDNSYGHPASDVLDLLREKGVKTLRTDDSGDVVIWSDGKKFWTEK